jgi:hypothetical protein
MMRIGLGREQEKKLLEMAEKMYHGAQRVRGEYESDWRELEKYFMPGYLRLDNSRTKRSKWSSIINNTCLTARRTLQAGMQSGLTSPARPWFNVGLEDFELADYQPVREWLDIVTRRMQTTLRRSNFYNTSHVMYGALATFGTAGQLQLFDHKTVFNYRSLMTGRYWIAQNVRGHVDSVFIKKRMTVMQLVEEYGERVDSETKGQYDRGDYYHEKDIMVGIFPNPYAKIDDGKRLVASNEKAFVSVHWVEGKKDILRSSGYDTFPAQVPRWERTDDEPWGFGVGVYAIGDTKAIQLKEKEKAKGLQKSVSPPLSAPAGMRHGQFPIAGLPGGVTYRPHTEAPDSIRPLYEVNLPLQFLQGDIQVDEERVNRAFYADLFLMLSHMGRIDATATEIAERHEEKLTALGPVIESLNHEFLDPNIERAFTIMIHHTQAGGKPIIPPPPEEIQGAPLKIEYVSVLAQAQQQVGIGAIDRYMSFSMNMAQLYPEVRHKNDPFEILDEYGERLGVPSRITVSADKARESVQEEKQMAQQQMAMQQTLDAAQAAKTLSDTQFQDENLLSTIL